MANYLDSHCHLNDEKLLEDFNGVLARAKEAGVHTLLLIGWDVESSRKAVELAQNNEGVYAAVGIHPENLEGVTEESLLEIEKLAASEKVIAIGEIGLDYHFDGYDREAQIFLLENMLQIAQDRKLPVSFHVRDAFDDFWPIFDNFKLPTSVMHSFSDSKKNLNEALNRGLYIGVNGLSTFADIAHPPLERMIFETDAPYLTPKPFRGTINMPGYVRNIAEWAADHYQQDFATISKITSENVEKIFKI
jgi:TatD DNase family protein